MEIEEEMKFEDDSDVVVSPLDAREEIQSKKLQEKIFKTIDFTHIDMILVCLLTFLSFWSRNFMIHYPPLPVFDESHFGNFTNKYLLGDYFQDIHPPFSKILLYISARMNEYKGNIDFYNNSGDYPNLDFLGLRQTVALFGSFCAPTIYIACRSYGFSTIAAFTAALMIICDISMIAESRHILTDGMLHFFVCLSIMTTATCQTQITYSPEWWFALVCNGLSIGFATSTKYTSLSLLPFAGFVHLIQVLELYPEVLNSFKFSKAFFVNLLVRALVLIVTILIVLFGSFSAHFILLPYEGSHMYFMPESFRRSLLKKSKPEWHKRVVNQSMIKNIIDLNVVMHKCNMGISGFHNYGSKWYDWPFLTGKWVLFWTRDGKHIMCMGQVFNVYAGTISVILCILLGMLSLIGKKFDHDNIIRWLHTFIYVVGYLSSLLPFALIKRALFYYHYIIPTIFGIMAFTSLVELYIRNYYLRVMAFVVACGLTTAAYIYWSPFAYALPIDFPKDFWPRVWNQKWR